MSKAACPCPVPFLRFLSAAGEGYIVTRPPIPSRREEVEGSVWLDFIGIPSGTSGNIDYVNGTSSGWTSLKVDKAGVTPMTGGKFFLLTAAKKDDASAAIVNNLITVSINSVEIGRIYVDADTQTCGWFGFILPGDREDARFALSGTSTTGDLIFALTAADPNLEIRGIILGND